MMEVTHIGKLHGLQPRFGQLALPVHLQVVMDGLAEVTLTRNFHHTPRHLRSRIENQLCKQKLLIVIGYSLSSGLNG